MRFPRAGKVTQRPDYTPEPDVVRTVHVLLAFGRLSGHTRRKPPPRAAQGLRMIKHETTHETLVAQPQRALASGSPRRPTENPRERRLMVVTLVLLLSTLGAVLYWDR